MSFRLLGPVEVWAGSDRVEVGSARLRLLLAALAVDAGRVVSVDVLVARLWGDEPPRQVRRTMHTYIARLRRVVGQVRTAGGGPAGVVLRSGGYLLDVEPDQVDALRFGWLVAHTRAGGGGERRLSLLREAVGLWRGQPLTGMPGEWAERTRFSLRQQRVEAVLAWAQAELDGGTPEAVLAPLGELAAEHPLVEPVAAMRMRALAAAGRLADALDCYSAVRRRLAEELGADPGPELRAAQQAVLRGELHPPPAATADTLVVPAQLPPDVYGFAGRTEQLARLDSLLTTIAARTPTAVVITAVSGTAGVGKTALAMHWAHRVAARFPDGQLYVNLRGFDQAGQVMQPDTAIRGFLDALGVPAGRIPLDPHAQTALYRSLLSGKRILVVLDNARDADQVRPLLPGSPTAVAVVTSRNQLTPLVAADGAHPLTLDLLPVAEAHELLARRLGSRVADEPEAADTIVTACARLPLALGIAAARAAQTGFSLTDLATELADAAGRLATLDAGDPATQVRAVFSWSYRALTPPAARMFRLLGLHPGPAVSAEAAVSLAAVPAAEAGRQLAELARANLITEYAPGRYRMHDLLACYATELTRETDAEAERRAATVRLLDHYLHSACDFAAPLNPTRDPIPIPLEPPSAGVVPERCADEQQAMSWLVEARPVLLAMLRLASAGFDAHTWQLAWALNTFLLRRGHWPDAIEAWQTAAAAADRLGRPTLGAHALRSVAFVRISLGRHDEARPQLERALELYVEADDRVGQAHTHIAVGILRNEQDQPDRALEHARQALMLFQAAGHRAGWATALNAVGWASILLGDHRSAITSCRAAIELFRQTGDRAGEAATWDSLGLAHHHLGEHAEAGDCYRHAIDIYIDLGDRYFEAATLVHAGDTHRAAGQLDAARTEWDRALEIFTGLEHPDAAAVRDKLAGLRPPFR